MGGVVAVGALIVAVALVALAIFGGGGEYTVSARFVNAGQLVPGNPVQSGGAAIGSVKSIELTDDSYAEVTFTVDELHAPLPQRTRAAIRQFSASGIANRYVDLSIPPDSGQGEIPDGGSIDADDTQTQIDLDQVLNAVDEDTRRALQDVVQGLSRTLEGQGERANRGLRYLNPALSSSSRLFDELSRDTPALERTLIGSAKLTTALAERNEDLAALVGNARDTTRALASERTALSESVARLPAFLRRANTTLLNTRAALDDVDPLVEVSKPVARRLRPFLSQARGLAADAEPTLRALRAAIRRPGRRNDAVELLRAVPRLADIAVATRRRSVSPGGRAESVGEVPGAFPQVVAGVNAARPVIAFARPYTTDFLGWLDDFSSSGGYFDGLGGIARTWVSFAENITGAPPRLHQFHRCPGGADLPYKDGSNVLSAEEQERLDCREEDRALR